MTYYDFPFFLSFAKYNIFGTIIYLGKRFLLRVQEEKVLWIDDADDTRYHCFHEWIYKLNVPKWSSGYIRRKLEKHIFPCESIGLVPNIEMTNISASNCPIYMMVGLLDSTQLVLLKSGEKKWSYLLQINYSTFKVIQRSNQGQRKMLFKKLLILLVLPALGNGDCG